MKEADKTCLRTVASGEEPTLTGQIRHNKATMFATNIEDYYSANSMCGNPWKIEALKVWCRTFA